MTEYETILVEATQAATDAADEFYAQYGDPWYCGFAWVKLSGKSAFGRAAKKAGVARKDYPTGLSISASKMGPRLQLTQSMDMKETGAQAFADVLKKHGIECYVSTRAD